MSNVVCILKTAKELIIDPAYWIKGSFKEYRGYKVGRKLPYGYCVLGAINTATEMCNAPGEKLIARIVLRKAVGVYKKGFGGLDQWNDSPSTTHADVLAGLDLAIAQAEKDQSGKTEDGTASETTV